jgi:hypothetical protein
MTSNDQHEKTVIPQRGKIPPVFVECEYGICAGKREGKTCMCKSHYKQGCSHPDCSNFTGEYVNKHTKKECES